MIFHIARIGLSLVANVPLNVEVDAKTDAAVGIARAFSFISSDKDTRQAFDWLIKVSNAIAPFHLNSYNTVLFGGLVRTWLLVVLNSCGFYSFIRHPKLKSFLF